MGKGYLDNRAFEEGGIAKISAVIKIEQNPSIRGKGTTPLVGKFFCCRLFWGILVFFRGFFGFDYNYTLIGI